MSISAAEFQGWELIVFYEYYERELKSNQIIQKLLPKNDWGRQFLIKKKIKMIESELK